MDINDIQPGGVLNNRYQLVSLEGSGGTADVYKALDRKLKRTVAVKVLRAVSHVVAETLEREAQTAARAAHPNVVTIYDVDQVDGIPYIVMEYVQGQTLEQVIAAEAPLNPGRALDMVIQVCAAVDFIHAQGTIHCDLKPQNIILLPDGQVKITDFGIARLITAAPGSQVWGTPHYASPELLSNKPLTPASDVYALGIILYEMLAGARPFEGANTAEIARHQILDAPLPLQQLNPRVPRYIQQALDRALAKDPARRYTSAGQFARLLSSYRQHGEAVTQPLPRPADKEMLQVSPSQPAPMVVAPPAAPMVRGPDWLLIALVLIALFAVTGLVPLWGTVISRAMTVPTPTVTPAGMWATPTPTWTPAASPDNPINPPPTATPERWVTVPLLVGKSLEEARQLAQQHELNLVVTEEQNSVEVPQGHIISQNIALEQRVAPQSEIRVVVSRGPVLVRMPNVVGFPVAVKELDLRDLGLQVFITRTWSIEPENLVVAQQPPADTEIAAGSTVTLTVSSGPRGEIRANLGYKLILVSCQLNNSAFRPGDAIQLAVVWQVLERMSQTYTTFIHVTRQNGEIVTQLDTLPLSGSRLTNTWQPGETLNDLYTLTLPVNLSPGTYWVRIGLYEGAQRMPVADPGRVSADNDALIVAQIEVR